MCLIFGEIKKVFNQSINQSINQTGWLVDDLMAGWLVG